jgi:hypothetical protein
LGAHALDMPLVAHDAVPHHHHVVGDLAHQRDGAVLGHVERDAAHGLGAHALAHAEGDVHVLQAQHRRGQQS